MFTGIILGKAKILHIQNGKYTIQNILPEEISIGQSIAHDGACMTIESIEKDSYTFFVMEESLHKTNFWKKSVGDVFNIELCVKANDRIDGHFVSGHIDCVGIISEKTFQEDTSLLLWVSFDPVFSKYTIQKWSIALNGVSLTIIEKKPGYISVSLIPLTQDWTNLGTTEIWDAINVEFDMLGKYILNTQTDV